MDINSLGPSAAVVIAVLAFLRYMDTQNKRQTKEDERRDKREEKLAQSIEKLGGTASEMYQFMKNLNGKLEKAIKEKVKE